MLRKLALQVRYLLALLSMMQFQNTFNAESEKLGSLKHGLHEPQLPVERSVTLVVFIVDERRRCAPIQQRRSITRE